MGLTDKGYEHKPFKAEENVDTKIQIVGDISARRPDNVLVRRKRRTPF